MENPQLIWRSGNKLVMHVNATLPDRCVKTNQPARGKRLKRDLYWHHPSLYLLNLAGILIYLIVALCVRKHAKIEIGVSDVALKQRNIAIVAGWVLCIGGIALLVTGLAKLDANGGYLLFAGAIAFLTGLIWGVTGARVVTPTYIDANYVWLKGVNKEYLDNFPELRTT